MKRSYALSLYGILAFICIVLDRLTKQWALAYAQMYLNGYEVTSWLSCDVLYNRGMSWGMLHGQDTQQFIMVSVFIACVTLLVAFFAFREYKARRCIAGHVLVIAGSVSNIFDRVWYGGVIDFIHLCYGDWVWPVFNVADVCIVAGALLMVALSVRES